MTEPTDSVAAALGLARGDVVVSIHCGSRRSAAGRRLSRHQALKQRDGRQVVDELRGRGIIIKSPSMRGVAEAVPGATRTARPSSKRRISRASRAKSRRSSPLSASRVKTDHGK
jgi:RNA-splicing ligase RtcB